MTNGIIKDIESFKQIYLDFGCTPEEHGYTLDDDRIVYPGENIIHDLENDAYFKDEDTWGEWLTQHMDFEVVQIPRGEDYVAEETDS